jgi:hypothetical protein
MVPNEEIYFYFTKDDEMSYSDEYELIKIEDKAKDTKNENNNKLI